ncbi:peptidoglycan D,D-transpeptidase FtsI family protein [Criblamydia sequanensis]|uniref:Cell division protein FtsI n=1 Tax=Candidatus Criblamydia sequanensis CRIB-18 TaxID=1437425 RepID=A0A090CZT2_9BACT|nr:penicillin-binding protein 2 [Criblamydia sequanensis]CDR34672.1 Putative cell division protein FtsI [Criblamydia sequanensis CRIB-18]
MAKKNNRLTGSLRKRVVFLASAIFVLLSLLILQFYRLQIIQGEFWTKKADLQHYFFVNEPFRRGRFFSCFHEYKKGIKDSLQLVVDIQKQHLYADPVSIPQDHKKELAKILADKLKLKKQKLEQELHLKSRSRLLMMWMSEEEKQDFLVWWRSFAKARKIPLNALFFVNDYQRSYPYGKLLGQVLHTIQPRKDEKSKQAIPTGGLELYFDELLRGKAGKRKMMRSPKHSFEMGEVIEEPIHGADIYLTIDPCLQAICEEEIEAGVKKAGAKSGWAVMMNPENGEILAMAQYPFFEPSKIQDYFSDASKQDIAKVKSVTDANEPGSVMKPITCAIALMANEELRRRKEPPIFDPKEKVAVENGDFPGRVKPIKDTKPMKWLNMEMALQKSSNIYMGRIIERVIQRLGDKWYRKVLQECFGFGKKTGIELPGESPGRLPSIGKLHPNGKLEWSLPTPFSLAIGHNVQANSIQLLQALSMIANGGYKIEPTLVRKAIRTDASGRTEILINGRKSDKPKTRVLPKSLTETVVQGLKYVTKPGGGGFRADIAGFTEAGKTATANKIVNGQYSKEKFCSSFIGFTPAVNPVFSLLITIDEPSTAYVPGVGHLYYGGISAAPIFRAIGERALEYLGIQPDDPHDLLKNSENFDKDKLDWMKEVKRLQEIMQKWNN